MAMPWARCSGVRFSRRFCARGDRSTCSWTKRAMSIFWTATIEKMRVKTAEISHGTHQLGLRCKSVKVLLGAIKTFISRCGSERPGPAGDGAVGGTGAEYMGGGGGVGPVGELINHPTLEFVESYRDFSFLALMLGPVQNQDRFAKCCHPR